MVLRPSRFGQFWGCENFPECRATHGAHPDGRPLGHPADRETKQFRIQAHEIFDRWWHSRNMKRSEAYRAMQRLMDLSPDQAHIAMFDKEQCQQLIARIDAIDI